ncbi:hypothetical protein H671_20767 [Cricetulus griseus]|nr:hypothetical protein H671_20767 [Cricetulus griseus]
MTNMRGSSVTHWVLRGTGSGFAQFQDLPKGTAVHIYGLCSMYQVKKGYTKDERTVESGDSICSQKNGILAVARILESIKKPLSLHSMDSTSAPFRTLHACGACQRPLLGDLFLKTANLEDFGKEAVVLAHWISLENMWDPDSQEFLRHQCNLWSSHLGVLPRDVILQGPVVNDGYVPCIPILSMTFIMKGC